MDTGVRRHALLQGIFQNQGSNLCFLWLLHQQVDSLPLSHLGDPLSWLGGTESSGQAGKIGGPERSSQAKTGSASRGEHEAAAPMYDQKC